MKTTPTINSTDLTHLNKQGELVYRRDIESAGAIVGGLDYILTEHSATILRSDVDKYHQGKGIGLNAYVQFITDMHLKGKVVHSDSILSVHAQRIYQKLADAGYIIKKSEVRFLSSGKVTTISRDEFNAQRNTFPLTYANGACMTESGYRYYGEPVFTVLLPTCINS